MRRLHKCYIKRSGLLCLLAVMCLLLSGCHSTKLADGFDKQIIKETGEEIINDVQLRGAKAVLTERMREDFAEDFDMENMEDMLIELTAGKGGFIAYTEETVVGRHYDETDEDFGVVLITASYEKGEINYTLTFDLDMNLVGFYPN